VERPESEWLRQSAPELRIVSDALWNAAHARLTAFRAAYLRSTNGQLHGRPTAGVESRYLLTGLATCAVCGGGMIVKSRDYGSRRKLAYTCAYHHQRGRSVCDNGLEVPMVATDHEVLSTIETGVLHPAGVDATIRKALDALRPSADARDTRREASPRGWRSWTTSSPGWRPPSRRAATSAPSSRLSRRERPRAISSAPSWPASVRRHG
jgi:hypothetical protein